MAQELVFDFFAGLRGWTRPFEERPDRWRVVSIDIEEKFDVTLHMDMLDVTADFLLREFGRPRLILASPPCEAFSVAALSKNWWCIEKCRNCENEVKLEKRGKKAGDEVWSHVLPDEEVACFAPWSHVSQTPLIRPRSEKAELGQKLVAKTLELVQELQPDAWIMENPVAMMRRLPALRDPELDRADTSYCQYGRFYRKPTDLWGNFPRALVVKPACRTQRSRARPLAGQYVKMPDGKTFVTNAAGEPCHESAPRGSKTGVQGLKDSAARAEVPYPLANDVRIAMEKQL